MVPGVREFQFREERGVASHEADIAKSGLELAMLLVGERLDRRRINHAPTVGERRRDRVLRHDSLAGRGVRGDEDRLATLDARVRHALEGVERKRVRA